jgi:hypothetical protein
VVDETACAGVRGYGSEIALEGAPGKFLPGVAAMQPDDLKPETPDEHLRHRAEDGDLEAQGLPEGLVELDAAQVAFRAVQLAVPAEERALHSRAREWFARTMRGEVEKQLDVAGVGRLKIAEGDRYTRPVSMRELNRIVRKFCTSSRVGSNASRFHEIYIRGRGVHEVERSPQRAEYNFEHLRMVFGDEILAAAEDLLAE